MNLAAILMDSAARWPARRAIVDVDAPAGRREISFETLAQDVGCLARGLLDLGLAPGDRVAMLMSNSHEYVESFLAIAWAGLVSVPFNIRLLENELRHMLMDSGARLLIADERLLARFPSLAQIPALGIAVVRGSPDGRARRVETLRADAPLPVRSCAPVDLASLMYTSGTTGLPKGVMLPHRSWTSVGDYLRRYLRFAEDEVVIHTAALTHGSGFLLLPAMNVGGTSLICNRYDPARTLELFTSECVTSGFMVPSMIQMLLDTDPAPLKTRLRSLYYAGSPIDPATLRGAMDKFGNVLIQSFAQLEVPMVLTMLGHDAHAGIRAGATPHLIRSAGRPVDGVELRIVDDDDHDVAPGTVGEIVAKAPQTMLGYWNRADATALSLREGWLHTGDLGRVDDDGYLYVVDRKKDMIISGGSNVYAREVEEALLAMTGIREVAVIGLPHRKWGEMVTAVLVAEDGRTIDRSELEAFCRSHLADYRRPKQFLWVDALPRNAYGKVLKRELRERMAREAGAVE